MGVDEVEAARRGAAAAAAASPGCTGGEPGGKLEELDLDPAAADLLDLVAHPAAALRGAGVGHEVGDDEDAHRLSVSARGLRRTHGSANWRTRVWIGDAGAAEHRRNQRWRYRMIYALMGYLHAAVDRRVRAIRSLAEGERGQGTVEYVGLILLVSLLMVGWSRR